MCVAYSNSEELCVTRIVILTQKKIRTVPLKYVLDRWRKDVRKRHAYIVVDSDDQ